MKAIQVTQFGGPEKLVYTDVEDVVAGKGEVCVRLYAAGVNPADVYTLTGTYAYYPSVALYPRGRRCRDSGGDWRRSHKCTCW